MNVDKFQISVSRITVGSHKIPIPALTLLALCVGDARSQQDSEVFDFELEKNTIFKKNFRKQCC